MQIHHIRRYWMIFTGNLCKYWIISINQEVAILALIQIIMQVKTNIKESNNIMKLDFIYFVYTYISFFLRIYL